MSIKQTTSDKSIKNESNDQRSFGDTNENHTYKQTSGASTINNKTNDQRSFGDTDENHTYKQTSGGSTVNNETNDQHSFGDSGKKHSYEQTPGGSTINNKTNDQRSFGFEKNDDLLLNPEERVKIGKVAEQLGSTTNTLRRYCDQLEKEGYSITKQGKQRLFSLKDIEILGKMLQCTEELNLNVELAAKTALTSDDSFNERLREVRESKDKNEIALKSFSVKLNDMFDMLSENFATKNEMVQLFDKVVEQDNQKDEIIKAQDEMILKLKEEREQDKQEKEIIQEQFKKTMELHEKSLEENKKYREDNERHLEVAESVKDLLEKLDEKPKKKFLGIF